MDEVSLNRPGLSGGLNTFEEKPSFCVCCMCINVPLVALANCKHVEFFESNFEFKFEYSTCFVCYACHGTLLEIYEFKRQVVKSVCNLNKQVTKQEQNAIKLAKLTQADVEIFHALNSDALEKEVIMKSPIKLNTHYEVKTEVIKIEVEPDYSDHENEIDHGNEVPLPGIKVTDPNTPFFVHKYKDKFKLVTLSEAELWEERKSEAGNEKYLKSLFKCESCIVGFNHEQSLKEHVEKRHTETDEGFTCTICKVVLNTESSFDGHMRRHYRRVDCGACGERFISTESAKAHYERKHTAEPTIYKCERDCGFTTTSSGRLRYHRHSHKDRVVCEQCEKSFVSRSGLKHHITTVHQVSNRTYSCAECSKTYKKRAGLLSHVKSAHGAQEGAYCEPCRKHFRNESTLKQHLNMSKNHINEADKKHVCAECDARFLSPRELKEHVAWKHLKNTKHKCEECNKIFINNRKLKDHISFVHEKKRPPRNKICNHCGRGFTSTTILRSHVRTHTGERPHKCVFCPATFGHKSALYTHKKLRHTQKTKLTCESDEKTQ